jgi:hypothetical protein
MIPHHELLQREEAIFNAQEQGWITLHDMLRQLLDLWHYYQETLKAEAS